MKLLMLVNLNPVKNISIFMHFYNFFTGVYFLHNAINKKYINYQMLQWLLRYVCASRGL